MEIKAFQIDLNKFFGKHLRLTSSSPFILRNLKLLKEEVDRDNDEKSQKLKTVLSEVSESDTPFEILELISDKGIKNVYRVLDKRSNREVVFATLSEQKNKEQYQFSLINDAWVSSQLEHPNIPPIYEVGLKDNKPYFLMKYLKGNTVAEILDKPATPNFSENPKFWLRIFMDVCDALAFAHSKGILHLDIKAENVYVNSFHETLLFDWGCALNVQEQHQDQRIKKVCDLLESSRKTGVTWGTPEFMSPEQAKGESDKFTYSTDTFLLGAFLYQIMTSKPLYSHLNLDDRLEAAEHTSYDPNLLLMNKVPLRLSKVVKKALAINQKDRYQHVEDLSKDIQAFLDDQLMSIDQASPWLHSRLFLKKYQKLSLSAMLVLALISGISLVYNYQLQKSETQIRKVNQELKQSIDKQSKLLNDLKSISSVHDINYLSITFEEDNLNQIETLLQFQTENPDYWFEKGRILCGELEFTSAKDCFIKSQLFAQRQSNQFRLQKSISMLGYLDLLERKGLGDFSSIDKIKEAIMLINDIKTRSLIFRSVYQRHIKDFHEQRAFFEEMINKLNPELSDPLILSNTEDGLEVILINDEHLRETSPFFYFPCSAINVSGSRVSKLYTFYNPTLKRLNISKTQITNISSLPLFKVVSLNIDELSVTYFVLKHLESIEECSLIKTHFLDYTSKAFLKLIPNLKKLHLSNNLILRNDFLSEFHQLKEVNISEDYPQVKNKSYLKDIELSHIKFKVRSP